MCILKSAATVSTLPQWGAAPYLDESSADPQRLQYVRPLGSQIDDATRVKEWLETIKRAPELHEPRSVESITRDQLLQYDGVYLCGGHGCLQDESHSCEMGQIVAWTHEFSMPLAAVCHGHCAMLTARDAEGNWPYRGYKMTSFSHDEEKKTRIYGRLPLVLEHALRSLGVEYSQAQLLWDSHVVEDRNLVTGQNPFSSLFLALTFMHMLGDSRARAVIQ
jgi:putative intracellular protease/amidase